MNNVMGNNEGKPMNMIPLYRLLAGVRKALNGYLSK
jgi:hypothetical protein